MNNNEARVTPPEWISTSLLLARAWLKKMAEGRGCDVEFDPLEKDYPETSGTMRVYPLFNKPSFPQEPDYFEFPLSGGREGWRDAISTARWLCAETGGMRFEDLADDRAYSWHWRVTNHPVFVETFDFHAAEAAIMGWEYP